jgi:hypothetical protein
MHGRGRIDHNLAYLILIHPLRPSRLCEITSFCSGPSATTHSLKNTRRHFSRQGAEIAKKDHILAYPDVSVPYAFAR